MSLKCIQDIQKDKRKEIYIFMLERFKSKNNPPGFCNALRKYNEENNTNYKLDSLTELMGYRPRCIKTNNVYWYDTTHIEVRTNVLYNCIKKLNKF